MGPAIDVADVSKLFVLRHNKSNTFRSRVLGIFQPEFRERREKFWVLRDINVSVERGESLALVGANGSGKSTLLKVVAGTIPPTSGHVKVDGRVVPMIELGLGFHPDLNGRQNIFLNASLFGLRRHEVERIYERIVAFSELGNFIDVPLRNYSSGMHARLAFSTAIHLSPDILLVDEVLAVGDERFQQKCLSHIKEFTAAGKTLVFVSHSADQVIQVCNRAVWLDKGQVRLDGKPRDVLRTYASPEGAPRPVS